jgi:hypothetical protein
VMYVENWGMMVLFDLLLEPERCSTDGWVGAMINHGIGN